jgi:PKD repeat protein
LKHHTAVSVKPVELKGVIKTATTSQIWYRWVFGDGTSSAVQSLQNATKYNVEVMHTYTGAEGTPFTARLQVDEVDNTMANKVEDTFLVKLQTDNLDSKVNMAIDRGLWYLYKAGSANSSYYHTFDGSPFMVWGYSSYFASPTASAVQAFEINGHKETGNKDEDPYVEYVEWGLNWLFNGWYYQNYYPMLQAINLGVQHGENPDTNGNGKGIECRDYGYRPAYQGGMVIDAIIATGTPDADCGRDFDGDGTNDTYREVVQDMCDAYAWGQYDDSTGSYGIIGGWRYDWNQWPDNSACQWGAIGLIPAQDPPWNCVVPQWVKDLNDNWLDYSHQSWSGGLYGGFGYTGSGWGYGLTPAGMVQLVFAGKETTDDRWVRCERWFADDWTTIRNNNFLYGFYSFAKAMRLALPNPVVQFYNGYDWYRGTATVQGLADKIATPLVNNGYWSVNYGPNLETAWCIIILRPVLFSEAPIACFDANPNPSYPDMPIEFDPRCSGHSEPGKTIDNLVKFEWDWDNDGTYDEDTATPEIVAHAFSCAAIPCVYPVALRVTDDSTPTRTATYVLNVEITNPPHPPEARPNGPYMVSLCDGDVLVLDGSASSDPDEGTHEAGCPTCPDDTITKYEWDLGGAPWDYGDAAGAILDLTASYKTWFPTAGKHDVGLRVTDNTAAAYPSSGWPDLTDESFAEVDVFDGCICDIEATVYCLAVKLCWEDVGADRYYIYRSFQGPNRAFQDMANTTDTCKTMGSFGMGQDTWFRVMAVTGSRRCLSKPVFVRGDPELCKPVADANGPYTDICAGDEMTLDGSASYPLSGTIVAWDWDLDNDGEYDDAFGETVNVIWTDPGTYTVGLKVTSSDSLVLSDTDETTVVVVDCARTPPEVTCTETRKCSNLSRYYRELTAVTTPGGYEPTDIEIYVGDTATPGFFAGPFKTGDVVRISNSSVARVRPGTTPCVAGIITVVGQPTLWGKDPEGLIGTPVVCP